ncbi:MAG TPA: alpha/beta hydrolase [Cyclobacteriaceae bacterium]|nr:alpha/beta hydrolase [Cyclobacteriaceae bacterium]
MSVGWKKWRKLILPLLFFSAIMIFLDSCMQFRMSQSEIDEFFAGKKTKGTLSRYGMGNRVINYLTAGEANLPLIVFVHGSPGSLSAFIDFMADSVLLKHAQLISVDRPGFGNSNFGRAEPSLEKQAALLVPILMEHRNQRPIILVGHSLGGPLIARLAMDYPDLVDGLVMVAPSIDPNLEPHEWYRAPLSTPFLRWLLPRSLRASNDEIYKLKPELEKLLPLWTKVKAKTIVIQGKKDSLVPWENADFAAKMISQAKVKLVLVDDMGHFVPWTNPELIRNAVLELVEDLRTEKSSN